MVRVRRRAEGVDGLVKSRRVSILNELACERVTVAVAKLSLLKLGPV